MKKYFPLIRNLHLYAGLFISPFIIIFGISALVINHLDRVKNTNSVKSSLEKRLKLTSIPIDTSDLQTGKLILSTLGIKGEIDYVFKSRDHLSIRSNTPGLETIIEVNTLNDSVFVKQEAKGAFQGSVYLHKKPGPHLAKFQKNTIYMKIWAFLADVTVYLILFLTVSGIFLWYYLKQERRIGIYATGIGALLFISLLLVILNVI